MAAKTPEVKVVLLGVQAAGKTCLVDRYLHGNFNSGVSATVGAAFGAKKLSEGNLALTLGIWDTAGAERYEAMSRLYYKQARAALICFEPTNRESFKKVKFWVTELQTFEPDCEIYITGTKADLIAEHPEKREVTKETVEDYAKTIPTFKGYFETSAKSGHNVDAVFNAIAKSMFAQYRSISPDYPRGGPSSPRLLQPPTSGKRKCC